MKRNFENTMYTDQSPKVLNLILVVLVEREPHPGGVTLVNSEKISKKTSEELMELEEGLNLADQFLKANLSNKLDVIGRQVQNLQELMANVIKEAKLSNELNKVACNFVKIPGHIYHLYEKPSGQKYFSMLSPEEWGNCPHNFLGSYRLEADLTWKSAEEEDYHGGLKFLQSIMGGKMKELLDTTS